MTRRNRTVVAANGKSYRVSNRANLLQGVAGNPGDQTDWRPRFLQALTEIANFKYACDQAGVSHSTVRNERQRNAAFDRAIEDSWEIGVQQLELAAWKRAADRSDLLMIFLLKHLKPNEYIDQLAIHQNIMDNTPPPPPPPPPPPTEIRTIIEHRIVPQDYRAAVQALAPPDEEMLALPEPQAVKIVKAETIDQDPIEAEFSEINR